jgi:hypothetical protein
MRFRSCYGPQLRPQRVRPPVREDLEVRRVRDLDQVRAVVFRRIDVLLPRLPKEEGEQDRCPVGRPTWAESDEEPPPVTREICVRSVPSGCTTKSFPWAEPNRMFVPSSDQ